MPTSNPNFCNTPHQQPSSSTIVRPTPTYHLPTTTTSSTHTFPTNTVTTSVASNGFQIGTTGFHTPSTFPGNHL